MGEFNRQQASRDVDELSADPEEEAVQRAVGAFGREVGADLQARDRAAEREASSPWRRANALAMAGVLLSLALSAPPQAEPWRVCACASIAAYVAAASVAMGGGEGGEGGAVRDASERRLRRVFGEEAVVRRRHRED